MAEEIKDKMAEEAEILGVTKSKIKVSGYKEKDPGKVAKELARHKKQVDQRVKNRIEKTKVKAKMTPIQIRKALLVGRFKAVRAKSRERTYSNKIIEAWTEEFNMINNNPKQWIKLTSNGMQQFTPGNKKKQSAKELLDSMNLD